MSVVSRGRRRWEHAGINLHFMMTHNQICDPSPPHPPPLRPFFFSFSLLPAPPSPPVSSPRLLSLVSSATFPSFIIPSPLYFHFFFHLSFSSCLISFFNKFPHCTSASHPFFSSSHNIPILWCLFSPVSAFFHHLLLFFFPFCSFSPHLLSSVLSFNFNNRDDFFTTETWRKLKKVSKSKSYEEYKTKF